MKKAWVVATISISCAILVYVLFQVNRVKSYNNEHSLRAIPSGAGLIIKAESISSVYSSLFETIQFDKELQSSKLIKNTYANLRWLDTMKTSGGERIMSFIKDYPFYCSFHAQGKDNVSSLYMFEVPNKRAEAKIEGLINDLPAQGFSLNKRKYNSQNIFEISNGLSQLFVCASEGILLSSRSSLLIESSIRQLQSSESWVDNESFQNIYKTVGAGSKLNMFINFEQLPAVLKPFAGKAFKKDINKVQNQSRWAELDVDISKQAFLLNGFLSSDNKGVISQLLINAQPQRVRIQNVLPGNTRAYISLALNDGIDINNRLTKYRKANNLEQDYAQQIKSIQNKYGIKSGNDFFGLLSGELALAYGDYNHLQPDANGLLVIKLKSASNGKEAILEMLGAMQKQNAGAKVAKVYKPDNDVVFNIYNGFSDNYLETCLASIFPKVPQKYLAFYEDNLIIANASVLLEQFIYSNILNKTLSNSKTHQLFLSNFSSRENVFAFCETAHMAALLGSAFEPLLGSVNEEQKEALNSFYGLGIQFSGTGKMIYTTSYLQYLPSRESEPRTIWQSLLDSTLCIKPTLVKNHYTKEREVVVQDDANNLYLLSNSGRVLWKKPLDSPIMSEVVQIDYYRNNKLQYLFNTANRIYLLDRNGNHVANFPVNLPSKASNGMAVFDYDNNRKYRFFIACENRHVYLYNDKGNIVSGWQFKKTDGLVVNPIQHFRSNGKDYIAFADNKRNYICDRRGNIRVNLKKHFVRNAHSTYFIENKNANNDCLVTTSSEGLLMKINLADGAVSSSELLAIDDKHSFEVCHINGKVHYLVAQPKQLKCINASGKKLFEKDFDEEINLDVDQYQFSANNIKFGVCEKDNGQIHLLNKDGMAYKGFPLRGNSRFSIGFLKSSASRFNLIVGGDENYIYNYQVD